jgi:hypothetical protein
MVQATDYSSTRRRDFLALAAAAASTVIDQYACRIRRAPY